MLQSIFEFALMLAAMFLVLTVYKGGVNLNNRAILPHVPPETRALANHLMIAVELLLIFILGVL